MTEQPPLDVAKVRADTPGCERIVHLNNAGASLVPSVVSDTARDYLGLESAVGGYEAAAQRADDFARVRTSLARLLGASPSEVAFATGDTAAFAKAWWGFVLGGGVRTGDHVVVDRIAYNSHYMALLQASRSHGVCIDVAASSSDGTVDLDDLQRLLHGATVLVGTHIGTHRGLINPVTDMARLAREHGVVFFLDACQSVGQLPIDVQAIGCDVLTGTGRKWLRAPRGTGLLFVRSSLIEKMLPPGVDGSSGVWVAPDRVELDPSAARFEEVEFGYGAKLGFGAAVDYALGLGLDRIRSRVQMLASSLRQQLDDVPGVTVLDGGVERSGIVSCSVAGLDSSAVRATLNRQGINCWINSVVSARLDMDYEHSVRFSPHYYNTEEELERAVSALRQLIVAEVR